VSAPTTASTSSASIGIDRCSLPAGGGQVGAGLGRGHRAAYL
jgi:hypothetical protein